MSQVLRISYLVISQLLLEHGSLLSVAGCLLHGSSDVLQSLLCLNLQENIDRYVTAEA